MAGIRGARVDYGDQGPTGSKKDMRSGEKPQDSSVPAPIRAGVPVGGSVNENTIEESASDKTTRPNSGSK